MAQPLYEITQHPVDMSEFGLNPYGASVYRVVWADSRKTKVMHRGKIAILPRYMHGDESSAAGKWVLEKWASGEVILSMTREQYAAFLATFPDAAAEEFPERGDYEVKFVFPALVDEAALKSGLRQHVFELQHRTLGEHRQEAIAEEEAKEQQVDAAFNDVYEEAKEEMLTR